MKNFSDGFFSVDANSGFLPIEEPLRKLPDTYAELQSLLDEMPVVKDDGSPGLLATERALEQATERLPNFLNQVKKEKDPRVKAALFRGYSFLASAYTLSPAHHTYLKTGKYGLANKKIPPTLAQPFVAIAEALEVFPWLDYHYAYSLGNFYKKEETKGWDWSNLSMAVKFSGMPDEQGFIMLHVDINQYSPDLVKAALGLADYPTDEINANLELFGTTLQKMNERRRLMWEASRWKHYNDFRVLIMGTKGNVDIFPEGLIYEGVWDTPHTYRGQTGAQDNIIPTADIISGVINYYPKNQLTNYLLDLRTYRPKCVQSFFHFISKKMNQHPLLNRLVDSNNLEGMVHLMKVFEEIYLFRNGHWQFVQKYIMQNTAYPKATGGTPITSWIPNQIKAVLRAMKVLFDKMKDHQNPNWNQSEWLESYNKKVQLLNKQLKIVSIEAFDPEAVFDLNEKMGYQDF